ncbi:hypothetical protein KO481_15750 [Nocardia sp. NEAU-G5]|uniref:Uncharacterized protein n=1 Tax=Nocardia albiluteola TaxID=2842303 RepID=A0ABS6AY42_9NOCA|nr:hypothetical protein [Nocardia albiluteola]MBU3062972.1 hypothetical protein [Nocardia albiluteola]
MSETIEIQIEMMKRTATRIEEAGQDVADLKSSFDGESGGQQLTRLCGNDSYGDKIRCGPSGLEAQVQGFSGGLSNISESLCGTNGYAAGLRSAIKQVQECDDISGIITSIETIGT